MATYFISDLHLCPERPDITASLHHFLTHIATDARALYILGDLFEFWIGDDDKSPLSQEVANMLSQFSARGVEIYHIHGNRDFFLKQGYGKRAQMTILPEHAIIELENQKAFILHGDTLCIEDHAYQEFRRKVHIPWAQYLYLLLPLFIRQKIANKIRGQSTQRNQEKQQEIMDVTTTEVIKHLRENKLRVMIHGHTHRPAIHEFEVDGKLCKRVVLGAWYDEISYLKVTEDSMDLATAELISA